MAFDLNLPSQVYQPGTFSRSVKNVPASREGMRLTLTRESWPDGPVATVAIQGLVGAQSWQVQFALDGGDVIRRDGTIAPTSVVEWYWPGVADGSGGRATQHVTDLTLTVVVEQAIRTAVTLETF